MFELKGLTKNLIAMFVLLALCAAAGLVSLMVGAKDISATQVFAILAGQASTDSLTQAVVLERIPRLVAALAVGASLALAGKLMQEVTRNPLADPSILGVNAGAALFVVIGIAFFSITSRAQYMGFALAGSALATCLVFVIGAAGGASPLKLALAGTSVSLCMTSFISLILLPRTQIMTSFRFWQIGSVAAAETEQLPGLIIIFIIALLCSLALSQALNILSLGDEAALALGTKPQLIRFAAASIATLLCAASTSVAGPIAFVGLMAPHLTKRLFRASVATEIILSALVGATLLSLADCLAKSMLFGVELEVGIVCALFGGPVFILLAVLERKKEQL